MFPLPNGNISWFSCKNTKMALERARDVVDGFKHHFWKVPHFEKCTCFLCKMGIFRRFLAKHKRSLPPVFTVHIKEEYRRNVKDREAPQDVEDAGAHGDRNG